MESLNSNCRVPVLSSLWRASAIGCPPTHPPCDPKAFSKSFRHVPGPHRPVGITVPPRLHPRVPCAPCSQGRRQRAGELHVPTRYNPLPMARCLQLAAQGVCAAHFRMVPNGANSRAPGWPLLPGHFWGGNAAQARMWEGSSACLTCNPSLPAPIF